MPDLTVDELQWAINYNGLLKNNYCPDCHKTPTKYWLFKQYKFNLRECRNSCDSCNTSNLPYIERELTVKEVFVLKLFS
jgi:hypothetical protein